MEAPGPDLFRGAEGGGGEHQGGLNPNARLSLGISLSQLGPLSTSRAPPAPRHTTPSVHQAPRAWAHRAPRSTMKPEERGGHLQKARAWWGPEGTSPPGSIFLHRRGEFPKHKPRPPPPKESGIEGLQRRVGFWSKCTNGVGGGHTTWAGTATRHVPKAPSNKRKTS